MYYRNIKISISINCPTNEIHRIIEQSVHKIDDQSKDLLGWITSIITEKKVIFFLVMECSFLDHNLFLHNNLTKNSFHYFFLFN
jgi:hypothetical protein